MEMYFIALGVYFILFVIGIVASRSFKLKSLSISQKNMSANIKDTIIVNPEIVGAK